MDLAIEGGLLVLTRTDLFAPGTHTQSGTVTEMTGEGPSPIENAVVERINEEESGWQRATTDRNGFYEMRGLNDGSRTVYVLKEGYENVTRSVVIRGDTRFDAQLVRR